MIPHDELDQLSAYVDGELDDADRARIDAHLPGCAECRATLTALHATVADLQTLPEPAPSEQDSWALRAAIAKARKPQKRWQRFMFASGAAAAAMIGIVAVLHNGSSSSSHSPFNAVGGPASNAELPLYSDSTNYTGFSAQNYLVSIAHPSVQDTANKPQPLAGPRTVPTRGKTENGQAFASYDAPALSAVSVPPDPATQRQLDQCVGQVTASTQDLVTPIRYEAARYDSTPAFLLVFRVADKFELWVMSRDPKNLCYTLYFGRS